MEAEVKVEAEVETAGEESFVDPGPFQCIVCKTSHDVPWPPESSRCCPTWWVVSLYEPPAIGYACMFCDAEFDLLDPPESSRCCLDMTVLSVFEK